MAHEVPGQFDQTEESRETLQSELEQLPEPVRALYERARGLVTKQEPGYDQYTVDAARFDKILTEKGLKPGVEGYMRSGEVYVGGEVPEFPMLTLYADLVNQEGNVEIVQLLNLSTRRLEVGLFREETLGSLVSGTEREDLPQESEEALLFTEALLDTIEGQGSVRFDLPKLPEEEVEELRERARALMGHYRPRHLILIEPRIYYPRISYAWGEILREHGDDPQKSSEQPGVEDSAPHSSDPKTP